jgi:hypothetical protein
MSDSEFSRHKTSQLYLCCSQNNHKAVSCKNKAVTDVQSKGIAVIDVKKKLPSGQGTEEKSYALKNFYFNNLEPKNGTRSITREIPKTKQLANGMISQEKKIEEERSLGTKELCQLKKNRKFFQQKRQDNFYNSKI